MNQNENNYESNKLMYILLLALSIAFIVIAIVFEEYDNFVLSIPTLILTMYAIHRKNKLFLPPLFVVFVVITMVILQLTKIFQNEAEIISVLANFIFGVFTCMLGLLMILCMISSVTTEKDKPFFVSLTAFCVGVAFSQFIVMGNYIFLYPVNDHTQELSDFIHDLVVTVVGSFVVATLFYLNRHNGLFEQTLDRFIDSNANALGLEEKQKNFILKKIEEGESSVLEFKSTLRTNLKTGEKDPRMEKAVLKTLVAFLNSRGGTLLIGVADDGTILGVDLGTFEGSKDKFGLHLNHLITTQIGGEFLPFINYGLTDFKDKSVMRVTCTRSDRPVFLNDGKEEIFYARSGPSTIELHGMELLYYANHNFGKSLKKKNVV